MKTKDITILSVEMGKNGISKIGKAWQLYKYKIRMDNAERWASAFFKMDVGTQGQYLLKEIPNPNNPNSTYLNIVRAEDNIILPPPQQNPNNRPNDIIRAEQQQQQSKNDLLSPKEQQQIAPQGEVVLNTPIENITLNAEENELLTKIKTLDITKITEQAFKETCANRLKLCGDNRQDILWRFFKENC